jgi:hypothetical protein
MKNILIIMIIAFASITFCQAQKIEIEKVGGGHKFTQNGQVLTIDNLSRKVASNEESLRLINKAKTSGTFATILGYAGGGLIGWPVGTAIGGGKANWGIAGIGAGLLAIAFPVAAGADKKTKQAVELYNASLNPTSFIHSKPELNVVANANGIGLSVSF